MTATRPRADRVDTAQSTAAATAIDADPAKTPIQAVRELRGLSQGELAQRSGVTIGTIVGIERGVPPDPLASASIADTLGVPAALLQR